MARRRDAQARAIRVITGLGDRVTALRKRVERLERHTGLRSRKRAGFVVEAAEATDVRGDRIEIPDEDES